MDEKSTKKESKFTVAGVVIVILLLAITIGLGVFIAKDKLWNNESNEPQEKILPTPEVTGGDRGKLGIDKNINESNIDEYLNRPDSVYRDMRMLDDPGNYEAIGGDSKLSGYIKGFEVVPLPYIIPVTGLPDAVGKTYSGKTLFYKDENGKYQANYEESLSIIEQYFPKDKVIFLMCGGGGYAGMTKEFLVSLGWDTNKIYNIGGYWYYDGKNNVEVKKTIDGKVTYDFGSVPYHEIKFDGLTYRANTRKTTLESKYYGKTEDKYFDDELNLERIRGYNWDIPEEAKKAKELQETILEKKPAYLDELIKKEESFVVATFNVEDSCYAEPGNEDFNLGVAAAELLDDAKIYLYRINLPMFKKTSFYKTVKYAPSIIVFNKGEIAAYTDANVDSFNNKSEVKAWLQKYIDFKN